MKSSKLLGASSSNWSTRTARPSDLIVVFRSLHDAAPRVREVFDEFGIPFSLESGVPLMSAAVIRLFADLLRLDRENWPFRGLVAVVTNNLLSVFDRRARAACEWLIRDLQIAEGRAALIGRLEHLVAQAEANPPKPDTETNRRRDRTSVAIAALARLRQLADALDELPESAPPTEWITAFERLGTRLGFSMLESRDAGEDAASAHASAYENRLAWQRIKSAFKAVENLATTLGESPQLTRADASHLLIDVATHESLPRPYDDAGRVRVLSASTARNIEANHVFLAGMSEQSFPSPERVGRLYAESRLPVLSECRRSAPC